ncbi:MAG TPA: VTT domain-containing protein [Edaphocola sp.]|nr:VTT domain-containing protein [Edaphocola sp.]
MDVILDFFQQLTNPEWIIAHGGLFIILFILFAETGILLGFFLPGDFLVFVTGTIISNSEYPFDHTFSNLVFWELMMIIASVLGNIFGYWFGNKSGNYLLNRNDTWYFKKRHIHQAKEFYDKKGNLAIFLAKFLPIIRTFAPIVAGIVKMDYKKFLFYNITGSIVWITLFCTLGFFLGKNEWVKENLEFIVLGMIIVTTTPVLWKMFSKKSMKEETQIQQ